MTISVLDLFRIGIGPSSSHTVGPMRAARTFALGLKEAGLLGRVASLKAELFGSLGATGIGHGSNKAVVLGFEGETPEDVDTVAVPIRMAKLKTDKTLSILGEHAIRFDEGEHLVLHRRKSLPQHPNAMRFKAFDVAGTELAARAFYSIGGGFVVGDSEIGADRVAPDARVLAHPFHSGAELLAICNRHELRISDVMLANEAAWRDEAETRQRLLAIWRAMQDCVKHGCASEGILPGGLKVRRRAPELHRQLKAQHEQAMRDPLNVMDWVNLYALAVNEENAAGGRVVTAPTNGAAGIIPAVLHYFTRFCASGSAAACDDQVCRFLLTAGAIGILFKENASISGAEVGCQGEVGSACAMAAGALCEVMGGTPEQAENAAEIGIEHNLGLTCDPIGGLVQIPCIERNAMGAVKAINAARMAIRGDGVHHVSLDKAIRTMRDTGRDMMTKYKETARGGLALNVVEVAVNVVEC